MNIFCVGRNYVEHAKELGNEVPEDPVIFMKPETALMFPTHDFHYPDFSKSLHYEAELVLRVSQKGRRIPEEEASQFYDAITVGIDFTARDIQTELKKKGLPWEKAKAWDQSAVLGTWQPLPETIATKPIHFSMQKNGTVVQKGITTDMIFKFDTIVSHISKYFGLNPGDLIYTGTPSGVGESNIGDKLEGYFETEKVFEVVIQK